MYVYWNILVMLMVLPHLRVNPTQKQRGGKTRNTATDDVDEALGDIDHRQGSSDSSREDQHQVKRARRVL